MNVVSGKNKMPFLAHVVEKSERPRAMCWEDCFVKIGLLLLLLPAHFCLPFNVLDRWVVFLGTS